RLLVAGALLDVTAELRQCDHRDLELAREALEAPAHLPDLLDATFDAAIGSHQLQVVDDDHAKAAALLELVVQAAGLGADLQYACVARVVDVERRVREAPRRFENLGPARLCNPAAT